MAMGQWGPWKFNTDNPQDDGSFEGRKKVVEQQLGCLWCDMFVTRRVDDKTVKCLLGLQASTILEKIA